MRWCIVVLLLISVVACVPQQPLEQPAAPVQPVVIPESAVSTQAPLGNASPLTQDPQVPLDLTDNLDESINDLEYST